MRTLLDTKKPALSGKLTRSGFPIEALEQAEKYLDDIRKDKAPIYAMLDARHALPLRKVKKTVRRVRASK